MHESSKTTRNTEERIREAAEYLRQSKAIIIVEGKKDERALREMGVEGEVVTLSRQPIFAVAESVAAQSRDAIILTDLDKEGKKLYGMLNRALQRLGVRVDDTIRNFLYKNTTVRQIEGMKIAR